MAGQQQFPHQRLSRSVQTMTQKEYQIIAFPVRAVAEPCDQKIRIRAWTLSEACWKPSVCLTRASPNKENSKKVTENVKKTLCSDASGCDYENILYIPIATPVLSCKLKTQIPRPAEFRPIGHNLRNKNHYCSCKKQSRTKTRFAKLHVS